MGRDTLVSWSSPSGKGLVETINEPGVLSLELERERALELLNVNWYTRILLLPDFGVQARYGVVWWREKNVKW